MNKNPLDLLLPYETSQKQSVLVSNLIVVLMMVSVGVGFIQLGARIYPGWQGWHIALICIIVSLESIFTRKRLSNLEGNQRIAFHASEWVAFAVFIKVLLYIANGTENLLEDINNWQIDFLKYFFTPEFLIALGVSVLVWFSSRGFSGEIEELNNGAADFQWDELGKIQNMLHNVRNRVAARSMWIGALVVSLAVLSRVNDTGILRMLGTPPAGYSSPIINVLFYFLLVMILLSLTQFALMRTRWQWQRLQISPKIARNWIQYGLIAFGILVAVIFFLPTSYSIGLFDTLRIGLNYILQAFMFLIVLITLPLSLCTSLFNLTRQDPIQLKSPQELFPPQTTVTGQPFPWLEFLRSLFFWIVFIGIIIVAIRYYFQQNTALWNAIIQFPLFRWINAILSGLWKWLRGANAQFSGLVQKGVKRLRKQRVTVPMQAMRRAFNLSRMSPREKIIHFYVSLLELGGERGLERKPAQTPNQYESRLVNAIPEIDPEVHGLTQEFLEARYSPHRLEEEEAQKANSFWERIKAILRSWKREAS